MKRMIAWSLAVVMSITCGLESASAVNMGSVSPQASITLSDYNAGLKAGNNSGEIRISYSVSANNIANSMGVSSISVYKSDGSYVTTITGTTGNGLVINSDSTHDGVYTYKGTSGASYYTKVTVFATIGSTSDSRTVTTSAVKAP